MNGQRGSKTAIGAAVLRAAHQLIDGEKKLLNDPVILKLLGDNWIEHIIANKDEFLKPGSLALRSHIILRSLYAEDCLANAYIHGVRQFIILGAGMDTFAYRQPDWAHDVKIIEADHSASQEDKLRNLQWAKITTPVNVSYVTIDFEKDNLENVFKNSLIDFTEPVFIACLGVLIYLSKDAANKIFKFTGTLAKGSVFIFTVSQKRLEGVTSISAERAALSGEPWITYFEPGRLIDLLNIHGFSKASFLSIQEASEKYFNNVAIKLPPPGRESIVKAIV